MSTIEISTLFATPADAASGTVDDKIMSPARVAERLATCQPLAVLLTAMAALTTSADELIYANGPSSLAIAPLTAFARTLLGAGGAPDARATLNVVPGTDVQAYDVDLAAIAALTTQPFGRSLLTGADVLSVRGLLALGSAALLAAGLPGGAATLDPSTGKLLASQIPQSVLGALDYQSGWDASANSPALPAPATSNKGWYYLVTKAGTTSLPGPNGAITDWQLGDWAVSDGTYWEKVDNSDQVLSVAGLQGAITAAALKQAIAIASADVTDATAIGRSILTAANVAAVKTLLAVAIGDVSGLAPALAGKLTGAGAWAQAYITFDGNGLSTNIAHGLGAVPSFVDARIYGDVSNRIVVYYKDATNIQFKMYTAAGAATSGTINLMYIALL